MLRFKTRDVGKKVVFLFSFSYKTHTVNELFQGEQRGDAVESFSVYITF